MAKLLLRASCPLPFPSRRVTQTQTQTQRPRLLSESDRSPAAARPAGQLADGPRPRKKKERCSRQRRPTSRAPVRAGSLAAGHVRPRSRDTCPAPTAPRALAPRLRGESVAEQPSSSAQQEGPRRLGEPPRSLVSRRRRRRRLLFPPVPFRINGAHASRSSPASAPPSYPPSKAGQGRGRRNGPRLSPRTASQFSSSCSVLRSSEQHLPSPATNGMGEEEQRKHMVGSELDQELEPRQGEEEKVKEEAKKSAPGDAEAGDGAAAEAASCDYCGAAAAAVYCRADAARLCLPCDRHVHGANGVCSRHARAPLCADCRAAGAVFRHASSAAFLCSNCDFGRHRDGSGGEPAFHDRCAVQPYSGCPPATELAALLGVPLFDKPAAEDGGWWNIWEEPQVLSLEDLIVPTTPCHGFQPLLTPSSPKNRSISADENMNEEILRQLGELAESDGGVQAAAGHEEAEQAGDQFPSWTPPPQYTTGHGNFGAENSHEVAATMPTPGFENGSWNTNDYHVLNDACKVELACDPAPVSSSEACLSSFVPLSEICPNMSNSSSMEENHQTNPGLGTPTQAFPKRTGFDVVPCPDRGSVISRYKEKRKTRRFDRQVRYESRKVRADGRLRIKGRFAKANQT